jgi:hypothetical protein
MTDHQSLHGSRYEPPCALRLEGFGAGKGGTTGTADAEYCQAGDQAATGCRDFGQAATGFCDSEGQSAGANCITPGSSVGTS